MNKNYLMIDGEKIPFTEEQVQRIKDICGISQVKLSDVPEGETFKIADIEFVKFPENSIGVPVVAKSTIATMKFGDSNNLEESAELREKLEGFIHRIAAVVGEGNIVEFETDLLALDGTDKYGKMKSKVSLLTLDFYRANRKIFDNHKLDKWWWLATADSNNNNYVLCVAPSGDICINCNGNYDGVRPFCILKSDIFVSK